MPLKWQFRLGITKIFKKKPRTNNNDKFNKRYKILIISGWSEALRSCGPLFQNVRACGPEPARNCSKSWCSLKKGLYQESVADV